jgi:hypothetical protein
MRDEIQTLLNMIHGSEEIVGALGLDADLIDGLLRDCTDGASDNVAPVDLPDWLSTFGGVEPFLGRGPWDDTPRIRASIASGLGVLLVWAMVVAKRAGIDLAKEVGEALKALEQKREEAQHGEDQESGV